MSHTLQTLEIDVRNTLFDFKGELHDLWNSSPAYKYFTETRIRFLLNEAGRTISRDLKSDKNVKSNFLTKDSDVLALPSDLLIMDRILIYDSSNDDKTSGTATGGSSTVLNDTNASFTTTVSVGDRVDNITDGSFTTISSIDSDTQLTCTALSGGTDNTFQSGDEYAIYDPDAQTTDPPSEAISLDQVASHSEIVGDRLAKNVTQELIDQGLVVDSNLEGKPSRFLIYEAKGTSGAEGVLYAQFDKKASKRYFIDVHYWPDHPDMSGDGDNPHIRSSFQDLYYHLTCSKIAQRLRDYEAKNQFMADYQLALQECKAIVSKRTTPSKVVYGGLVDYNKIGEQDR